MIVYCVKGLFSGRKRFIKMRVSNKSKRRHDRVETYRRIWFWHEDRWNQRHGINKG
jgi:hypothetical protein